MDKSFLGDKNKHLAVRPIFKMKRWFDQSVNDDVWIVACIVL